MLTIKPLARSAITGFVMGILAWACADGRSNTVSIDDVVKDPEDFAGREIRVNGWVVDSEPGENQLLLAPEECLPLPNLDSCPEFFEDEGRELPVPVISVFLGALSEVRSGDEVIVSGRLDISHFEQGQLLLMENASLVEIK